MNGRTLYDHLAFGRIQALLWLLALPVVAGAGQVGATSPGPSPPDTVLVTEAGLPSGDESLWGPIMSLSDSSTATFENRGRKTWEYVVLAPYQIIDIPLRLVFGGVGAAYRFLDNRHVVQWTVDLFGPTDLPFRLEPNIKAGGLDRFGLGLTFYHDAFLGERNRLKAGGLYTITDSQKYSLGVLLDDGGSFEMQLGGGYRLRTTARYFGLGPDTREEDRAFYKQEVAWGGVSASQLLPGGIRFELGAIYSGVAARTTNEAAPKLEDIFRGDIPTGFGERSTGWTGTASLLFDNTTETGRPDRGTVLQAKAMHFQGNDDLGTAFWLYRFDAEQFVPLWHTRRALALRGYMNWISDDASEVPFQRLMTNDEPDLFRGFDDFRWRDRGMIGFTAEYRFPFWNLWEITGSGADAYLFADLGQVFNDFDQIGSDLMTESYGIGIRSITARGFRARFEFGWSREDATFRLALEQMFQYAKGGLYQGRDKSIYR